MSELLSIGFNFTLYHFDGSKHYPETFRYFCWRSRQVQVSQSSISPRLVENPVQLLERVASYNARIIDIILVVCLLLKLCDETSKIMAFLHPTNTPTPGQNPPKQNSVTIPVDTQSRYQKKISDSGFELRILSC